MSRHKLSDPQWEMIADLFPRRHPTGRPPREPRNVMNGILWILRTGAPWRDLPQEFGAWQTAWDRFNAWEREGVFDKALRRLQSKALDYENPAELWCIDGTSIRAARCASGGGKKRRPIRAF